LKVEAMSLRARDTIGRGNDGVEIRLVVVQLQPDSLRLDAKLGDLRHHLPGMALEGRSPQPRHRTRVGTLADRGEVRVRRLKLDRVASEIAERLQAPQLAATADRRGTGFIQTCRSRRESGSGK
jgi:hypothetical protein